MSTNTYSEETPKSDYGFRLQKDVKARIVHLSYIKTRVSECTDHEKLFFEIVEECEKEIVKNKKILRRFNFDIDLGNFLGPVSMRVKDLGEFIFAFQDGYVATCALSWLKYQSQSLEKDSTLFGNLLGAYIRFFGTKDLVDRKELRHSGEVKHFKTAHEARCHALRRIALFFRKTGQEVAAKHAQQILSIELAMWTATNGGAYSSVTENLSNAFVVVEDTVQESGDDAVTEEILWRNHNFASKVRYAVEKEKKKECSLDDEIGGYKSVSEKPLSKRAQREQDKEVIVDAFVEKIGYLDLKKNELEYRKLINSNKYLFYSDINAAYEMSMSLNKDVAADLVAQIKYRLKKKVGWPTTRNL